MFIMHIAMLYGIMVLAGGFVAFHFVQRFPSAPLKVAAWILVIGGALNLLCSSYYAMRYVQNGYSDGNMVSSEALTFM